MISTTDGSNATSYVLSDGLGSTSQLADTTGAVTDSYTYDVFGAPRTVTGTTANDFRFTGQQGDHNANRGLYYLRARHYDPALGRFLSRDPVMAGHLYSYAESDPVNRVDPNGREPGTPTPGVGAGISKAERHKRCLEGFVECQTDLVKQAMEMWGPLEPHPGYFRAVCGFMLLRCEQQSVDGSFDFGLARQQMGLSGEGPWWSRLLDAIPIPGVPHISLPFTGSGGYIHHRGDKESAFGCAF